MFDKFDRNKAIKRVKDNCHVYYRVGEIVQHETRAESHVTGTGGGGKVTTGLSGKASGNVAPVNIRTDVVTVQEFWLKEADGTETQITLRNCNFEFRDGHKILAVWAGNDKGAGPYVAFKNLITGQEIFLDPAGFYSVGSFWANVAGWFGLGCVGWWVADFLVDVDYTFDSFTSVLGYLFVAAVVIAIFTYFMQSSIERKCQKTMVDTITTQYQEILKNIENP